MKKIKCLMWALVFLCFASANLNAAEPVKIVTAWQNAYESFIPWYAHKKGWDKEEGIELEFLTYRLGREMLAEASKWQIGAAGILPVVTSPLLKAIEIIGVANDESNANAIVVRKDNPLLKLKGVLKAYPDILGDRATIKGMTILCPPESSAEYLLDRWLGIFDLTRNDVKVISMTPIEAYQSFIAGEGDALALWAPLIYEAEDSGLKLVATSQAIKIPQPLLLLANKKFADENPKLIVAFLRMYLRGVKMMREESIANLTADYKTFYKERTGKELNDTMVVKDITTHLVFTLDEQNNMFDSESTLSTVQNWLKTMAEYKGQDITEINQILQTNMSGDFLKQIREPIKDFR